MPVTKTFIQKEVDKRFQDDTDRIDSKAYAEDSRLNNLKEDYGVVPTTENERLKQHRMATQMYNDEYKKLRQEAIQKEKATPKSKKEINLINVEGEGILRYKKGFQGEMANVDAYEDIRELRKLAKEKGIASKKVREMLRDKEKAKNKIDLYSVNKIIKESEVSSGKISQKLRKDRLLKKEQRIKMYETRMKKFKSLEKQRSKIQRALARGLKFKSRAEQMGAGEVRAMYQQNYSKQNDGNLLHTPNLFTTSDGRERSVKTDGTILSAPNLLLRTGDKRAKQKWF